VKYDPNDPEVIRKRAERAAKKGTAPGRDPNDQGVPGDVRIHTRSIGNVETARLERRLKWFRETNHMPWLNAL
jgi:hypothetical protein